MTRNSINGIVVGWVEERNPTRNDYVYYVGFRFAQPNLQSTEN